jgi:hypothetical protein
MAEEKGKQKKRRPKGKPDNPEQSRKLIEAGKKVGVDEDGKAFRDAMNNLLRPKGKGRGSK